MGSENAKGELTYRKLGDTVRLRGSGRTEMNLSEEILLAAYTKNCLEADPPHELPTSIIGQMLLSSNMINLDPAEARAALYKLMRTSKTPYVEMQALLEYLRLPYSSLNNKLVFTSMSFPHSCEFILRLIDNTVVHKTVVVAAPEYVNKSRVCSLSNCTFRLRIYATTTDCDGVSSRFANNHNIDYGLSQLSMSRPWFLDPLSNARFLLDNFPSRTDGPYSFARLPSSTQELNAWTKPGAERNIGQAHTPKRRTKFREKFRQYFSGEISDNEESETVPVRDILYSDLKIPETVNAVLIPEQEELKTELTQMMLTMYKGEHAVFVNRSRRFAYYIELIDFSLEINNQLDLAKLQKIVPEATCGIEIPSEYLVSISPPPDDTSVEVSRLIPASPIRDPYAVAYGETIDENTERDAFKWVDAKAALLAHPTSEDKIGRLPLLLMRFDSPMDSITVTNRIYENTIVTIHRNEQQTTNAPYSNLQHVEKWMASYAPLGQEYYFHAWTSKATTSCKYRIEASSGIDCIAAFKTLIESALSSLVLECHLFAELVKGAVNEPVFGNSESKALTEVSESIVMTLIDQAMPAFENAKTDGFDLGHPNSKKYKSRYRELYQCFCDRTITIERCGVLVRSSLHQLPARVINLTELGTSIKVSSEFLTDYDGFYVPFDVNTGPMFICFLFHWPENTSCDCCIKEKKHMREAELLQPGQYLQPHHDLLSANGNAVDLCETCGLAHAVTDSADPSQLHTLVFGDSHSFELTPAGNIVFDRSVLKLQGMMETAKLSVWDKSLTPISVQIDTNVDPFINDLTRLAAMESSHTQVPVTAIVDCSINVSPYGSLPTSAGRVVTRDILGKFVKLEVFGSHLVEPLQAKLFSGSSDTFVKKSLGHAFRIMLNTSYNEELEASPSSVLDSHVDGSNSITMNDPLAIGTITDDFIAQDTINGTARNWEFLRQISNESCSGFSLVSVDYIHGDCNRLLDEIRGLPAWQYDYPATVLSYISKGTTASTASIWYTIKRMWLYVVLTQTVDSSTAHAFSGLQIHSIPYTHGVQTLGEFDTHLIQKGQSLAQAIIIAAVIVLISEFGPFSLDELYTYFPVDDSRESCDVSIGQIPSNSRCHPSIPASGINEIRNADSIRRSILGGVLSSFIHTIQPALREICESINQNCKEKTLNVNMGYSRSYSLAALSLIKTLNHCNSPTSDSQEWLPQSSRCIQSIARLLGSRRRYLLATTPAFTLAGRTFNESMMQHIISLSRSQFESVGIIEQHRTIKATIESLALDVIRIATRSFHYSVLKGLLGNLILKFSLTAPNTFFNENQDSELTSATINYWIPDCRSGPVASKYIKMNSESIQKATSFGARALRAHPVFHHAFGKLNASAINLLSSGEAQRFPVISVIVDTFSCIVALFVSDKNSTLNTAMKNLMKVLDKWIKLTFLATNGSACRTTYSAVHPEPLTEYLATMSKLVCDILLCLAYITHDFKLVHSLLILGRVFRDHTNEQSYVGPPSAALISEKFFDQQAHNRLVKFDGAATLSDEASLFHHWDYVCQLIISNYLTNSDSLAATVFTLIDNRAAYQLCSALDTDTLIAIVSSSPLWTVGNGSKTAVLGLGVPRAPKYDPAVVQPGSSYAAENTLIMEAADDISLTFAHTPLYLPGLRPSDILSVDSGPTHNVVVLRSGSILVWGNNKNGQLTGDLKLSSHLPSVIIGDWLDDRTLSLHAEKIMARLQPSFQAGLSQYDRSTDIAHTSYVVGNSIVRPTLITLEGSRGIIRIVEARCGIKSTVLLTGCGNIITLGPENTTTIVAQKPGVCIRSGSYHWVGLLNDNSVIQGGSNDVQQLGWWYSSPATTRMSFYYELINVLEQENSESIPNELSDGVIEQAYNVDLSEKRTESPNKFEQSKHSLAPRKGRFSSSEEYTDFSWREKNRKFIIRVSSSISPLGTPPPGFAKANILDFDCGDCFTCHLVNMNGNNKVIICGNWSASHEFSAPCDITKESGNFISSHKMCSQSAPRFIDAPPSVTTVRVGSNAVVLKSPSGNIYVVGRQIKFNLGLRSNADQLVQHPVLVPGITNLWLAKLTCSSICSGTAGSLVGLGARHQPSIGCACSLTPLLSEHNYGRSFYEISNLCTGVSYEFDSITKLQNGSAIDSILTLTVPWNVVDITISENHSLFYMTLENSVSHRVKAYFETISVKNWSGLKFKRLFEVDSPKPQLRESSIVNDIELAAVRISTAITGALTPIVKDYATPTGTPRCVRASKPLKIGNTNTEARDENVRPVRTPDMRHQSTGAHVQHPPRDDIRDLADSITHQIVTRGKAGLSKAFEFAVTGIISGATNLITLNPDPYNIPASSYVKAQPQTRKPANQAMPNYNRASNINHVTDNAPGEGHRSTGHSYSRNSHTADNKRKLEPTSIYAHLCGLGNARNHVVDHSLRSGHTPARKAVHYEHQPHARTVYNGPPFLATPTSGFHSGDYPQYSEEFYAQQMKDQQVYHSMPGYEQAHYQTNDHLCYDAYDYHYPLQDADNNQVGDPSMYTYDFTYGENCPRYPPTTYEAHGYVVDPRSYSYDHINPYGN